MKSITGRELSTILSEHPDAEVWFEDINFGGRYGELTGFDLRYQPATEHSQEHFLVRTPSQAYIDD